MDLPEHFTVLPNDQSAIEAFVRDACAGGPLSRREDRG